MSASLSSLVDNLSEIYGEKCRDKNCKCEWELIGLKNNRLQYKCKECKKGQLKPINGLSKNFSNTDEFCNGYINEFVLLLRKGVDPYKYMDSWERFDETSLPDIIFFTVNWIWKCRREFMWKLKTTNYETWNVSKISFIETLRIINVTAKCIQPQTNQPNSVGLQKYINMKILMKWRYNL